MEIVRDLSRRGGHREQGLVVPPQAPARTLAADFDAVYSATHGDVLRYALAMTRSVADAEEVCADTFERALRSWDSVPDAPLPWLLLTARRIATDRWRRARHWTRLMFGFHAALQAHSREEQSEFWVWFDEVCRLLTDRQREVLVLRYQRDLTDGEIAHVMGISQSGVRSLVARALEVLRTHPEVLE